MQSLPRLPIYSIAPVTSEVRTRNQNSWDLDLKKKLSGFHPRQVLADQSSHSVTFSNLALLVGGKIKNFDEKFFTSCVFAINQCWCSSSCKLVWLFCFQLVVVNEELVAKENLESVSLFTTSTSIIIDFKFILLVLTRSALFNSTALLIFHNILKMSTKIILPGLAASSL